LSLKGPTRLITVFDEIGDAQSDGFCVCIRVLGFLGYATYSKRSFDISWLAYHGCKYLVESIQQRHRRDLLCGCPGYRRCACPASSPTPGGAAPDGGQRARRPPDFCRLAPRQPGEIEVRGLGLHFPGYLLGVEKTSRQTLGLLGGPFGACSDSDSEDIFRQAFLRVPLRTGGGFDDPTCLLKRRLDDRRRMFLSHVVAFRTLRANATTRIGGAVLYDVYARNDLLCTIQQAAATGQPPAWEKGVFFAGRAQGLAELENALRADLLSAQQSGKPYSHVFVYVMGWNTGEAASISLRPGKR